MRAPRRGAETDARISAIAARQSGVVSRRQLLEAGVSPGAIQARLTAGRLTQLHQGVYGFGPVAPNRGAEWAAVLACGDHAFLCGASAAWVWGVLPGDERPRKPEVGLTRGDRRRPGIRVRRISGVRRDELTRVEGMRITTPGRTLLDLAGSGRPGRLVERAVAEAFDRGLVRRKRLLTVVHRHPYGRGGRLLREILSSGRLVLTRSEAEERFRAVVQVAGLPEPEANVRVGRFEVDFLWRHERLVVEVDGLEHHGTPAAIRNDRHRDLALAAAGLQVVRVIWTQIVDEPVALGARLAEALLQRRLVGPAPP